MTSTILAATLLGQAPTTHSEPLIGEAVIGSHVFLPITVHGQSATVILDVGSDDSWMFQTAMAQLGVSGASALDLLTFGTRTARQIPIGSDLGIPAPPGMGPAAGVLGADILSHYDLVVDGPAQRMRLYQPLSKPAADASEIASPSARPAWFPPGITAADCVPMESDPQYPDRIFFPLTGNGHAIHSMFDSGSGSTNTNLAGARVFGITKRTPGVRLTSPGSAGQFMQYNGQRVWRVPEGGIPLHIGPHVLTPVALYIYQHLPRELAPDDAQLSVGLDAVQDRIFFVSYSTRRVCLGTPSAAGAHAVVATATGSDGDDGTLVPLTLEALAKMTAFWTTFLTEPPAVRDTGRQHYQKPLTLTLDLGRYEHQAITLPAVVDMEGLAAQYPSVAADLTRHHLTAAQWEQYRKALFTAVLVNQALQGQVDTAAILPATTGKNVAFLRAHPLVLAGLMASGMWFPTTSATSDESQSRDFGGDLDP